MNIALWIVAGVFAIGFVAGGIIKLTWPHEKYAAKLHWAQDFTPGKVKFMGAIEILGGLGLVLPALFGVAPVLVPIAASGMALYMAGAVTERIRRSEYRDLLGDLVFLAAMLFVAWGRYAIAPFS
ncbi:DoxX family protein [Microbacterium pseudoresistens]|uniref:Putative membrane protein n=1 Tax=Microbacterium pseudoresistens TaxID=640634 RepID=A0A7Y9JLQ2_9MICO|nr:DoxX family protein [Microbacterium pseudoresistens]NYD53575.1 putative membrane protein [Microbacterium pseudoresistens]